MLNKLLLLLCGAMLAGMLQAKTGNPDDAVDVRYGHDRQVMSNYIPNNTPAQRYTLHGDGTATDNVTGLMWQRCSLGQTLNGSTCSGSAGTYNWRDALQQGDSNSLAGYSDWRLPNVNELLSLVAHDRYNPSINKTVFPNWMSHEYVTSTPGTLPYRVWVVHFRHGNSHTNNRNYNYYVRLVRNHIPTIDFIAPAQDTPVDASYTIQWTASSYLNGGAAISLYYDTDNSGNDGTLITDSLIEGTHTSYNWDTASLTRGDYYVYAKIDDGLNPPVYEYAAGKIRVNSPPSITVTAPASNALAGQNITISWTASDADDQASISLYYDNNNSGNDGTLIVEGLLEGTHNSYSWDTSSLANGDHYIYAKIDDGINQPVYAYGAGVITADFYIDFSNSVNNYGGFYNAPNHSNNHAFATLTADGSISAWGDSTYGGSGAPSDSGYTKIYATSRASAALKADGSVSAWGHSSYGGSGAPNDSGYTKIYSTSGAFAAIKADGSITAWGDSNIGGSGAPIDSGYVKIYATWGAFAAVKADGSITAWGSSDYGGSGAPSGSGYVKVYATAYAFAALKADGSVSAWGHSSYGGSGAPSDSGYISIYSNLYAFAAIKADGSITAWGNSANGGSGAPTDSGYVKIYSTSSAFAAVKADGSITAWGSSGGSGAPSDSGYIKIYATWHAFAAVKADGSITAWGDSGWGGSGAPSDSGYVKIYSTGYAFAAIKADGSITAWGHSSYGGSGAPNDGSYIKIYATWGAFAAIKGDGSITTWGDSNRGGSGAPSGSRYSFEPLTELNTAPSITITQPDSNVIIYASYTIEWTASDADNQASISLYYDTNNSGNDGTLITASLVEGTHTFYIWDSSSVPTGDYFLYAKIDDGINQPLYHYASVTITIGDTFPGSHPLNDTGIDWGANYPSGENTDCSGETISQQDCSFGRDAQARAGTLTKMGGGAVGYDFTRLNADGSEYAGSGNYASDPWACVRDNHTGLTWEVKTDDGGIHDKDNTYRWGGKTALVTQQARDDGWGPFYDDWNTLVDGSNSQSLCGFNDWRVPNHRELVTIVHIGIKETGSQNQVLIDSNYFPNTQSSGYHWSSFPYVDNSDYAWIVYFGNGGDGIQHRGDYSGPVRLVRGGR